MKSSNIGGQAVMEGVMMMNKDRYSVAVRRPDGEIEVKVEQHKPLTKHKGLLKVPILRGVFSFADSMIVGMSSLMYSASFYEDEEEEKKKPATKEEEEQQKAKKEKTDRLMMYGTVTFSVVIAVVLFLMVPYFLSELLHKAGAGTTLTAVAEAFARVALFLGYLAAISRMEDIQRVFMYHGAEHKCINCVEHGLELNVENVLKSSREHKRCGTSFLMYVIVISIIFFMFIRVDSPVLKIVIRLLLIPVIAGVSYEIIRLAGKSDNKLVNLISKPGLMLQHLTTREPDVAADAAKFQKLMKEQAELQPIADAYKDYKTQKQTIEESLMLLEEESDEEMREMLKEELSDAKKRVEELEQELKVLLLPKDPNDDKNVIVEFRAGAGGDEAALFTAEICRMYIKYAESRGWKTELTSADENGIGGFKDATLLINGAGAYSRMKYESGTHRVQRVPETESGGRIHTSTMTVAIMPEVDDVEVQIDPKDYKFDVFRASGNGGQCVNTTDSAVRLTHFPSGIVISCQDEKSQLKNKDKALKILRARLYDLEQQKQHDEMAELRKSQVGTGDRSEKIRTYNFPQGRVTDHRIKLTLYKLDAIMNGDLDEIIDSLIAADQAAKLSSMQEEA